MTSAIKFEMMYQARMLSSQIVMKAMKNSKKNLESSKKMLFLETLDHCRFEAGYYEKNQKPFFTEIANVPRFDVDFFIENEKCFTIIEDKSEHLGIRYIVLKENELSLTLQELRIKIIEYLVFSFIVMGIVGYFLGRLFMRPLREQIESLDR